MIKTQFLLGVMSCVVVAAVTIVPTVVTIAPTPSATSTTGTTTTIATVTPLTPLAVTATTTAATTATIVTGTTTGAPLCARDRTTPCSIPTEKIEIGQFAKLAFAETCPDYQTIRKLTVCKEAALEMGKLFGLHPNLFTDPKEVASSTFLAGCFIYNSGMVAFNDNLVGSGTQPSAAPICTTATTTTSTTTTSTTTTTASTTTAPTTTTPVASSTTTITTTTTTAPVVPDKYMDGKEFTKLDVGDTCAEKKMIESARNCYRAADEVLTKNGIKLKKDGEPQEVSLPDFPQGCYVQRTGLLTFNTDPEGSAQTDSSPLCLKVAATTQADINSFDKSEIDVLGVFSIPEEAFFAVIIIGCLIGGVVVVVIAVVVGCCVCRAQKKKKSESTYKSYRRRTKSNLEEFNAANTPKPSGDDRKNIYPDLKDDEPGDNQI